MSYVKHKFQKYSTSSIYFFSNQLKLNNKIEKQGIMRVQNQNFII